MVENTQRIMRKCYPWIMSLHILLFYALFIIYRKHSVQSQFGTIILSMIELLFLLLCVHHLIIPLASTEKRFWKLIWWAFFFYFTGEMIQLYYMIVFQSEIPLDSWGNIVYLMNGTLLPIAVFTLFFNRGPRVLNIKVMLDISIIGISILTVGWGFIIYPLVLQQQGSLFLTLMSIWYPITDIALVIALLYLMVIGNTILLSVRWLSVGIIIMVAGDILNMSILADQSAFIISLAFVWNSSFAAIVYAGLCNYGKNRVVVKRNSRMYTPIKEYTLMLFPYVTLVILIIVMIINHGHVNAVIIGTAICNYLIIFKQLLILVDNKRKISELTSMNRNIQINIQRLQSDEEQLKNDNQTTVEESYRDHLTGAFNRRYLEKLMKEQMESCENQFEKCSVIMLDIDYFKEINDRWGHLAGDETLRQISTIMKEFVRGGEAIIRYGGDEFTIFLPRSTVHQAALIAERIRMRIADRCIPGGGQTGCCTISAGVSEWEQEDQELSTIINRADCALYVAKMNGRNRCEMFTPDMVKTCS